MSIAAWLSGLHGFDPQHWFALLVCTNRGQHDAEPVGVIYQGEDGIAWAPYTRALREGEVAETLSAAEREEILEWSQYVAREPILIGGALAFSRGDPVPSSHVERGVVARTQVDQKPPDWPALAHVSIFFTRVDDERVRELRINGAQGWLAHGRGSMNVICEAGCTLRIPRERFDEIIAGAARVGLERVDLSRL